ncbi:MAG: type 1 periplasmic binding fold superfamily protein, partial [Leeuwenhoekiella sp.]
MKTNKLMTLLFLAAALASSCSSDDDNDIPELVNEEEVITTMNVTLTAPGGDVITFQSRDLDGDGPNAPVITVSGPLAVNTIYSGEVELLNQTETPADNITLEVMEENEEHQLFFSNTDALDVSFAYADTENDYDDDASNDDDDANPVGILFTLSTVEASSGTVSITLIHEPEK